MDTTTQQHRLAGFALKNLSHMEGRDGLAHTATITLNGNVVGDSHNSGQGGCDLRHFTDKDAKERFAALARELHGEGTFEVEDALMTDLITTAELNRKRGILVLMSEHGDIWDKNNPSGTYAAFPAKTTLPQVVAWLRKNDPEAKIWSKAHGDFLPLDQF